MLEFFKIQLVTASFEVDFVIINQGFAFTPDMLVTIEACNLRVVTIEACAEYELAKAKRKVSIGFRYGDLSERKNPCAFK